MRNAKRWFPVHVRYNEKIGKWDKKPAVEWSNRENWSTYDEISNAPALGFALGDGFFGIDLDGCLEPDTGAVRAESKALVDAVLELCPSFCEVSWSGKGLHVYGMATMPSACKDATPGLEMYGDKRFFLFTGRPFDANDLKPLADIQAGVEALYRKYGRPETHNSNQRSASAVGEGHRSNEIFAHASVLYKLGYSAEAVTAAMQVWNREHCRPPLDAEVVKKQCEDRYPTQRFEISETDEQKTEIMTYASVIEIAAKNLVEFCEQKRFVSTGFTALDSVFGRLSAGSMTVIGGETGAGKSFFVQSIALHAASTGNKPGIISLEDGIDEWGTRGIARITGVTFQDVIAGKLLDGEARARLYEKIYSAPDKAKSVDVQIGFAVSANMETVMNTAKTMVESNGRNVLLVDYAQAVRVESDRVRLDKAYADVSKRLKGLCAKYKIPLVLNSQLSRSKTDPNVNSLKESGDIENEAEIVILLWREKGVARPRTLWRVAKAKWTGARPEGYVRFGIGGSIEDLVTEDISSKKISEYLE